MDRKGHAKNCNKVGCASITELMHYIHIVEWLSDSEYFDTVSGGTLSHMKVMHDRYSDLEIEIGLGKIDASMDRDEYYADAENVASYDDKDRHIKRLEEIIKELESK